MKVFNDYKKFVKLVHDKLPATRIIYIGIKPSRSRWSLWPEMTNANAMIRDFSGKDRRLFYFDSATPLLGSDGKPDDALFLNDQLHLNDKGYEVWTKQLRPIIEKAFKQAKKAE